jgi:hypothetical protein
MPFGGCGVVIQDIADISGFPAGVANGVPGVAYFELGEILLVCVHGRGGPAQQESPVCGGNVAPGLKCPGAFSINLSVSSSVVRAMVSMTSSVAGFSTSNVLVDIPRVLRSVLAVANCGFDESVEEPEVVGILFRVELDPQRPSASRRFQRFYRAVGRRGSDA